MDMTRMLRLMKFVTFPAASPIAGAAALTTAIMPRKGRWIVASTILC